MNRTIISVSFAAGLALAAGASAQQPPPSAAPKPQTSPASAPEPATMFTYSAEGRRDPFISLLGRGAEGRSSTVRLPGLPGQTIGDLTLKGIVRDSKGFFALVLGADTKTYTVRVGDRLLDGTVKAITADAVVFSQDVNDPLSLQKQREIRKSLRPGEESRG